MEKRFFVVQSDGLEVETSNITTKTVQLSMYCEIGSVDPKEIDIENLFPPVFHLIITRIGEKITLSTTELDLMDFSEELEKDKEEINEVIKRFLVEFQKDLDEKFIVIPPINEIDEGDIVDIDTRLHQ